MSVLPVISVTSERTFSTAGNILRSQRAYLLSENTSMLIFIKHNKAFYDIFKLILICLFNTTVYVLDIIMILNTLNRHVIEILLISSESVW